MAISRVRERERAELLRADRHTDMMKLIHKENPTRCNSASKFYFLFI